MATSLAEENYLKIIYRLSENTEQGVSTNAVAELAQTKAASVTDMLQKLAEKTIALKGKDEKRDIEASRAETERLNTVGKVIKDFHEVGISHANIDLETQKTLHDMKMDHIDQIQEANQQTIDQQGTND